MPDDDPTFGYLSGQRRPHHAALLAAFGGESAAAIAALRPDRDVLYGAHPRQRFDFFRAPGRGPVLMFLHAGYWQGRDKDEFAFLAAPLVTSGLAVANVNYPLCPETTLDGVVEAVRDAVPAVLRRAGAGSLLVAGHSAGAHLAVELAATDWRARGHARSPVAGVLALSGVFDLAPLLGTPLNDALRLDAAAARRRSTLDRVLRPPPPAVFAVGGGETDAFRRQSTRMHAAWVAAGGDSRLLVSRQDDHFTLLRALVAEGTAMRAAAAGLVARCSGAGAMDAAGAAG